MKTGLHSLGVRAFLLGFDVPAVKSRCISAPLLFFRREYSGPSLTAGFGSRIFHGQMVLDFRSECYDQKKRRCCHDDCGHSDIEETVHWSECFSPGFYIGKPVQLRFWVNLQKTTFKCQGPVTVLKASKNFTYIILYDMRIGRQCIHALCQALKYKRC